MIKTLSAIGNSLGLIIERLTVELLHITKDTPLEITTDGVGLIVRPVRQRSRVDHLRSAADELMDAHEETFRRLPK